MPACARERGPAADRAWVPAQVAISVDFDALRHGVGIGMLDTGVPISASAVRRICCDATVIRTLLSGAGVPLDVGRAERVFRKKLRRAIVIRDIGCCQE